MSKHFRWRRFFALTMTYVLTLHTLILPLSAGADAFFRNSLCSAASADTSQGSGDPGHACVFGCVVSCCSPALDARANVFAVILTETRPCTAALTIGSPVRLMAKGPQTARAPPA
jgi:hypothetical protein